MKSSTAIILLAALAGHSVAAPAGNTALQAQQQDTDALKLLATHLSTGELTSSDRALLSHLLVAASSLQKRGADAADATDGIFSPLGGGIGVGVGAGLGGLLAGVSDLVTQLLGGLGSTGLNGSASVHLGNSGGLNLGGSLGLSVPSGGLNLSGLTGAVSSLPPQNISLPSAISSPSINITIMPANFSLPGNVSPGATITLPGNTISLPANITGTVGNAGVALGGLDLNKLSAAVNAIFRRLVGDLDDSVLSSLINIITNAKGNVQKATDDSNQFAASHGLDASRIFAALKNVLSLESIDSNATGLLKGSGGLLGGILNALNSLPRTGSLGPINLSGGVGVGSVNTTIRGLPGGTLGGLNITVGNIPGGGVTTTVGNITTGANGGISLPGGLTLAEIQHLIDFIHGATSQLSVTTEVQRIAALHNLDPVSLARLLQSLLDGSVTPINTGIVPNGTIGGLTGSLPAINVTVGGGLTAGLPGINGSLGGLGGLGIGLVGGSNLLGALVTDVSGLLTFLLHLLGLGGSLGSLGGLGGLGGLGSLGRLGGLGGLTSGLLPGNPAVNLTGPLGSLTGNVTGTLGSTTGGLPGVIGGATNSAGSTLGSVVSGLNSTLPGLAANLTSGLGSTVGSTVGNLGSTLAGAGIPAVGSVLPTVGSTVPGIGVNLNVTISTPSGSTVGGLGSALSGIASTVTGLGNGLLNATGLGSIIPGLSLSAGGNLAAGGNLSTGGNLSAGGNLRGNGTLGLGIGLKNVQLPNESDETNTALAFDPSGSDEDDEGSFKSNSRRSHSARFRASVRTANAGVVA